MGSTPINIQPGSIGDKHLFNPGGGNAAGGSSVQVLPQAPVQDQLTVSVRVVATTNIDLGTPPSAVSGITLDDLDRVLLAGQTDKTQNGIYMAGVWSRAADDLNKVRLVYVAEGEYADKIWKLLNDEIEIGVDDIEFQQDQPEFSSAFTRTGDLVEVVDIADNAITNNKIAAASKIGLLADITFGAFTSIVAAILAAWNDIRRTFLSLNDAPSSYSGAADKLVAVNGTGTALVFVAAPTGIPTGGANMQMMYYNGTATVWTSTIRTDGAGHVGINTSPTSGQNLTIHNGGSGEAARLSTNSGAALRAFADTTGTAVWGTSVAGNGGRFESTDSFGGFLRSKHNTAAFIDAVGTVTQDVIHPLVRITDNRNPDTYDITGPMLLIDHIQGTTGDPIRINVGGVTMFGVDINGYTAALNGFGVAGETTLVGDVLIGNGVDGTGEVIIGVAGKGISIAEGTNARMGVATLAAGTVTIPNTAVTANSRIFVTAQSAPGGPPGALYISDLIPGTSFDISSSLITDTCTVAWEIKEPV